MNGRPNIAGLVATGARALAEAAALNEALSRLGPQGGMRLQDFDDRVQRAVTAKDIEEAFGIEFERLEDRLTHGPELTPLEKAQHDQLERVLVLACQCVEARELRS